MSLSRRLKHLFAAALLVLAALSPAAPPPPEKLRQQLAAATTEKYPNADTVTVYDCDHVTYQTDGLAEYDNRSCVKVLTEAGRKSLRRRSFNFNGKYAVCSVSEAAIVKPDGRRIGIDLKKNSSVAISPRSMGSNIYSDKEKVLTLVLPQLEVGDAVLMTLKYKFFKTPFPGMFAGCFHLQDDSPVIFAEVTVNAPEKLPLRSVAIKSAVADTVKFHGEKRENGRIVYRWTAENVPQVIPEPDMPPLRGVLQRLLVSTAKDWKEISRWYYDLCRPRLDAVDDALKSEVAKIVAGKKTDREKAMALFQFVSQKIRYTGVDGEHRAPGFEPHDVKDTFRQRHGVCRDKAGLLVAMLELAGLKAYPVLFYASQSTVDDEVPADRFNPAIVAWETAPGQYQLMDPTCESTQEFFPAYLANQSYIVARPEGDVLRRSPSPPPENNLLGITTVASIAPDGRLTGESTFEFRGYHDLYYRGMLARHGKELVRQLFSSRLQQAVPGAEIFNFKVVPENVRDMSRPLGIVISYTAPDSLTGSGMAMPLPMPELAGRFGRATFMMKDVALDTRRHPLRFDTTAVTRENIRLELPDSVKILSLPPEAKRQAPGAEWERKFTLNGNTVGSRSSLTINALEVAPEEYVKLRELRRKYTAASSALPLFRTRYADIPTNRLAEIFPDSDSFVEDEKVAVNVAPDGSTRISRTVRRRILTYAGIKKHSELKIAYTPQYQQLDIRATVTTPDGVKHRLSPKHVIDMDAAWVASAPRYPKARIKVAVLPAVQVGALVETTVVLSSQPNVLFGFSMPLRNHAPAARRELSIGIAGRHKHHCSPPPAEARFHTGRQGGTDVSSLLMTDLPPVPKEVGQPEFKMFVPTMFLSVGDYAEYTAELDKKLRELAAAPSPAADRLFAGMRHSQSSKMATALKIRDAVAQKLRSAGPALSDVRPEDLTPPERTLNDGYGNSADRAVVIAALLDRAGIKYDFVAASRIPYLQKTAKSLRDHPQPVFKDVLVYIPELNIYLNDTDQYAVPGSTEHASKIGLSLKSGRLTAIRPGHKAEDATVTTFHIAPEPNGSAAIDVTVEFFGTSFNLQKRASFEMTPEERRQFCELLAAELLPEAKLEKTKCDFSQYPGKIEFKFKADGFARAVEGGKLIFELPGGKELIAAVNAVELGRRTPALRSQGVRKEVKYRIKLPAGCRVERRRPPRIELGRRNSSYFAEHSTITSGQVSIDARLVLPTELIQPCDYVELMNLQRDLVRHFRRRIVLSNKGVGRR